MKIAYIAGAFKPFTAGHAFLINSAAKECDEVKVFVSIGDRARKGEKLIPGSLMKEIWEKYIIKILPENVNINFTKVPIKSVYETIGEQDKGEETEISHVIYADDVDASKNFPSKALEKYLPRLHGLNKITIKGCPRTTTVNISGTAMRKFLELGLKEDFIAGLPEPLRENGEEIWKGLCEEK